MSPKTEAEEALIVAALEKDAALFAFVRSDSPAYLSRCITAEKAYDEALSAVKQERGA